MSRASAAWAPVGPTTAHRLEAGLRDPAAQPHRGVIERHECGVGTQTEQLSELLHRALGVLLDRGDLDDRQLAAEPQRRSGAATGEDGHVRPGLEQAPRGLGRGQGVGKAHEHVRVHRDGRGSRLSGLRT